MSDANTKGRSHWPIIILSTFATFISLLLPLLLVRVLTPEEVGKFRIFFLYLTIIPALALTSGVMSGLAYWAGHAQRGVKPIKMSSTIILFLAVSLAGIVFAARQQVGSIFGWSEEQTLLFAFAILGAIAASYFEEAAISTGRIWTGALFYSGFEVVRTAAILAALFYYRSLTAVLLAHTIIVLVKVVFGYAYGYKLNLVGIVFTRGDLQAVSRYAFPVSLAWVFGIFVTLADQFILSTSISSAEFALYSIGCLAIAPLLIFEHSITRVLIPQMSEAFAQRNTNRAAVLYQAAVENLSFLLIPAVSGLIIFASPIIEIFFTSRYSAAAQYLKLYAITYLFLIIPYDAIARARGKSGWILRTFVIFSMVSLSLAFVFTKLWGPLGALSAVLISGATMRLYSILYFRAQTGLDIRRFLPLNSFLQYSSVCLALAVLVLLMQGRFANSHLWFLVCGSIFAVLYLVMALPLKNRNDRIRHPANGVLFITQTLEIGGIERMVLHLCEKLQAEKRWQVHVMAYDQLSQASPSLLPEFKLRGIPVEVFKKPGRFSIFVVARILRSIYRNDIAIIHSQDLGGLMYATLAKVFCFGRVALVHTQHSFIHLERKTRYRLYEKFLTYFIDKLSVVSEDTKKTYLGLGIDEEKVYLIQNGVEFSKAPLVVRPERVNLREALISGLTDSLKICLAPHLYDYWILYLARFFPGKGQEHALALWGEMPEYLRRQSILCFIGPESAEGQYNRIRSLAEKVPDASRVFLLGASAEPERWLKVGDLYLSCSEFEGMPLGPLEAVGSGLPTLLSNIPGHDFLRGKSSQYPLKDYKRGAYEIEKMLARIAEGGETYFQELWQSGHVLRESFSVAEMSRKYSCLYSDSAIPKPTFFSIVGESLG